MALVDVICPMFNSSKWLKSSLNSLLNQNFRDWRLILIDDGSTDNSVDIALQILENCNFEIFQQPKNLGVAKAFARGIKESNAKYVARMDSDDINFPSRLDWQVEFLENNKAINALSAPMIQINAEQRVLGNFSWNNLENIEVKALLPMTNVINNPTTFFRAEIVQDKFLYSEDRLGSDYLTWLRFHEDFVWFLSKKPLLYWRRHAKNLSQFGYKFEGRTAMLRKEILLKYRKETSDELIDIINGTKFIRSKSHLEELSDLKSELAKISNSCSYNSQLNRIFSNILFHNFHSIPLKVKVQLISEFKTIPILQYSKKIFNMRRQIQ